MQCSLFAAMVCLLCSISFAAEPVAFRSARTVWPAGRETEMNLLVGYRATFSAPAGQKAILRIAASTIYRFWINGEYGGFGPARGPHGYYRVDEWDLTGKLKDGQNLLAIEVAGYNVNSYYLLDQPSFLQAEVVSADKVLASTAGDGTPFAAGILSYRVQKVQRYSFQRPFIEVYRLNSESDAWRRNPVANLPPTNLALTSPKNLLPRRVPLPQPVLKQPIKQLAEGRLEPLQKTPQLWKDRSLVNIGPQLKGYPEKDLAVVISTEAQLLASKLTQKLDQPYSEGTALSLSEKTYRIFDLGTNFTGFLRSKVTCSKKTRLWLAFDEILSNGDVDSKRLGCVNIVSYDLEPGTYDLESMEPYTLRYLKVMCLAGECQVTGLALRECAHPPVNQAQFAASDERLNKIFAAGIETFRQNSLDIFMDCPSRERAGWLCDSFFTSRVANDLTGAALIEHNFFENYLLPPRFQFLPDGMLPMCYPSDHNDGIFIPNWAMWFVVELDEYAARTGDRAMIESLRPKVTKLLEFFKRFENEDGLLEKLPSWVFVEWSKANEFVQDVNYPSNMLYAGVLSAAGRMYNEPQLIAKADKLRETIRKQSFDGEFFVDNALRKDGKLQVTKNHSEVCQYFAFFFDVANPKTHAQLWQRLRDEFGPNRKKTNAYPNVYVANSFIGNVLRMEILSANGRGQQILDESIAYLLYMADRTGTLWENTGAEASCDHGFASHACHTLYRDVLGLYQVDRTQKQLRVRFNDLQLDWCEGQMPVGDGIIHLKWRKAGNKLAYTLTTPPGYNVSIENLSGRELVKQAQ
ncbi:MAG: hypothetical protein ACM359_18730 [Bacillota bacterium]